MRTWLSRDGAVLQRREGRCVDHRGCSSIGSVAVSARTVSGGPSSKETRFTPNPAGRRGREHVLGVIDAYLAAAAGPRQARVVLRLRAAAIGDEEPSPREAFTHRDAFFREHFEHAIAEGVGDDAIRTDIDPPSAAVALVDRGL
jgi:hypothetical protein